MSEHNTLLPGSVVRMTGFVDLNQIYIKPYTDTSDDVSDRFNEFCLSAKSIIRPLTIGEIVGFRSPVNNSFYRGKVLRQLDETNYQIQLIDYGETVEIPKVCVVEIPEEFKVPSTIICVALKGVEPSPLNLDAIEYISMMLSACTPMIIDFPPTEHSRDVTLTKIDGNENVNKRLLEILPNDNSESVSDLMKKSAPEHMFKDELLGDNSSKFKTDSFNIIKPDVLGTRRCARNRRNVVRRHDGC